jgi:hypothetical protein
MRDAPIESTWIWGYASSRVMQLHFPTDAWQSPPGPCVSQHGCNESASSGRTQHVSCFFAAMAEPRGAALVWL